MDSAVNIYICNDKRLITNFIENPTKVGRLTPDSISPSRKNVKIDKKPTFDRVHLSNSEKDPKISGSMSYKDKIKIKKYARKVIPSVKH